MITLEQISTKLDNILNGVDEETSSLVSPANEKYFFKVATEGLSFTNQNDMISGKNFIPVFIGSFGGEFNPVKGLGEANLSIQVQFYYQADLKEDFYKLTDFLVDVFVGGYLTFGTQKAVCNIEPPTYGELQTNDITKFKDWVTSTYKQSIKVSSVYMTMTMTLHINTAKDVGLVGGFVYGNSYSCSITIKDTSGNTILTDTNPIFANQSQSMEATPNSEQVLGTNYSKGVPNISAYGKTIPLYIKNSTGYASLIQKILDRETQNLIVSFSETYNELLLSGGGAVSHNSDYFINSILLLPAKGSLLTISLTLGDRI